MRATSSSGTAGGVNALPTKPVIFGVDFYFVEFRIIKFIYLHVFLTIKRIHITCFYNFVIGIGKQFYFFYKIF